jgi:hypothetical protein
MIKKSIARHEVEEALLDGEIIEEYPDDKHAPSCLIYGRKGKKFTCSGITYKWWRTFFSRERYVKSVPFELK